jgi:hypothetical protein
MIVTILWGILLGLLCVALIAVAVGIGVGDEPDKPRGWISPLKGEIPKDRLAEYQRVLEREKQRVFPRTRHLPPPNDEYIIKTKEDERAYLERLVDAHGPDEGLEKFLEHRNEVIMRKEEAADRKDLLDTLYAAVEDMNQARSKA